MVLGSRKMRRRRRRRGGVGGLEQPQQRGDSSKQRGKRSKKGEHVILRRNIGRKVDEGRREGGRWVWGAGR